MMLKGISSYKNTFKQTNKKITCTSFSTSSRYKLVAHPLSTQLSEQFVSLHILIYCCFSSSYWFSRHSSNVRIRSNFIKVFFGKCVKLAQTYGFTWHWDTENTGTAANYIWFRLKETYTKWVHGVQVGRALAVKRVFFRFAHWHIVEQDSPQRSCGRMTSQSDCAKSVSISQWFVF